MLRDDARARIQQTLGFRSDKASEIVNALQDAQVTLEREATLPWFLLTDIADLATIDTDEKVALPTDFLREWEDDALSYFDADSNWTALAKEDIEFLRDKYPGEGAPVAYSIENTRFRIFPTPDAVYTLKLIYFKKDTVLSSNITNGWLTNFPYLMIGEAGRLFSPALRDKDATAQFERWATEGRIRMLIENEARFHSSRRYVMGGQD